MTGCLKRSHAMIGCVKRSSSDDTNTSLRSMKIMKKYEKGITLQTRSFLLIGNKWKPHAYKTNTMNV